LQVFPSAAKHPFYRTSLASFPQSSGLLLFYVVIHYQKGNEDQPDQHGDENKNIENGMYVIHEPDYSPFSLMKEGSKKNET